MQLEKYEIANNIGADKTMRLDNLNNKMALTLKNIEKENFPKDIDMLKI